MKLSEFKSVETIDKGWSEDKKYKVTKEDGKTYLLRISKAALYEKKQIEFERMKQVAALGVPMCQPIEFGLCEEGAYSLQRFIDGEDVESVIAQLPDTEQYEYGQQAGQILRKIHSISVTEPRMDWETRFNQKIDRKIKGYNDCPLKYEDGNAFLTYIQDHRFLLNGRPQCFQHGDYHIGNMMFEDGKLIIIDFDRSDIGDPWEEFNRIVWCAQASPLFASGMVNGYFEGTIPFEFWELLALYIASNTLSSLYWSIPFGQGEVDTMVNQANEVLKWYDNMQNPVPTWYFAGYNLSDGMECKL